MQFQFNADYPGVAPDGSQVYVPAQNPPDFPPAQPIPCARITTRVYNPTRNQVATVQNVLVRTDTTGLDGVGGGAAPSADGETNDDDQLSWSSGDISSTMSDESMTENNAQQQQQQQQQQQGQGQTPQQIPPLQQQEQGEVRAYWIQRTVREAIYGRVFLAVVLKRRTTPSTAPDDNAEWEVTNYHCAVKEMSWQHIRRERDRLAEDPIKEVSAMQYLKRWHHYLHQQQTQTQDNGQTITANSLSIINSNNATVPTATTGCDGVLRSFQAILETNIMMPLDLLSDDRNLYSIMPYCNGGELFERLDLNERFTEAEARYWMRQILNGLENLQNAGITHRDMSLENLLVHQSGALIIDLGMCLRIPYDEELHTDLYTSFDNMTVTSIPNNVLVTGTANMSQQPASVSGRNRPRHLINPQGTCGKWMYMSPEIYKNNKPFDGFAVDMWAAGVILFLMLTGFPPWERACMTDDRFKYMTAGYLVQMLTEWEVGLSGDAMDLLQRMLFLDPKDRLSLDQVRAHPWMVNGPLQPPIVQGAPPGFGGVGML